MIMRILLLLSISWVIGLTEPIFEVFEIEISGRSIILFLRAPPAKATFEIHEKLEGEETRGEAGPGATVTFASVITEIVILDLVFSLDSVITAVGMADEIGVMIAAVVIAIGVMLVSAKTISDFVNRHPTVKMLALSFLLIGMSLVAEAFEVEIPRGTSTSRSGSRCSSKRSTSECGKACSDHSRRIASHVHRRCRGGRSDRSHRRTSSRA